MELHFLKPRLPHLHTMRHEHTSTAKKRVYIARGLIERTQDAVHEYRQRGVLLKQPKPISAKLDAPICTHQYIAMHLYHVDFYCTEV